MLSPTGMAQMLGDADEKLQSMLKCGTVIEKVLVKFKRATGEL